MSGEAVLVPAPPVGLIARFRQARAGLGFAALLVLAGPWLLLPRGWGLRRGIDRLAWSILLGGFGLKVRRHGQPVDGAGTLFVANHISWTDIPVLATIMASGFVAKAEVAGWPLIGRLASAWGCVFVERERRGRTHHQAAAMEVHLSNGHGSRHGLVLFPEATTGEGGRVLPFRSSLFAPVTGKGTSVVQPVSLRYRPRHGRASSPSERRLIAWIDDDGLLEHVARLSASGGALVDVWFEAPITDPALLADRKALARACEQVIAARLAVEG